MKIILYDNIRSFADDTFEFLLQNEIQNNLLISNCLRGISGYNTDNWFMGLINDNGGDICLIFLMTPPHNIVLYEVNNIQNDNAVELLANEIKSLKISIPGVLAEKKLANRFAAKYLSVTGNDMKLAAQLRIYRLDKVNGIGLAAGRIRAAKEKDLYFLPYWNSSFNHDCHNAGMDIMGSLNRVKRLLLENALYIWEDEIPVSQAALGRRTVNGAIVGAVYTPPHYRGKGFATACVASLSNILLESGYEFCSLFTDLANPISNSIYMKIGYKPVCDYDEYGVK